MPHRPWSCSLCAFLYSAASNEGCCSATPVLLTIRSRCCLAVRLGLLISLARPEGFEPPTLRFEA